jgi:hypothetical protein
MALSGVELFVFAISATIVVRASKARLLQNFHSTFTVVLRFIQMVTFTFRYLLKVFREQYSMGHDFRRG